MDGLFGSCQFLYVHLAKGIWPAKCSHLSTLSGWMVRKGIKSVHVVFECPLVQNAKRFDRNVNTKEISPFETIL